MDSCDPSYQARRTKFQSGYGTRPTKCAPHLKRLPTYCRFRKWYTDTEECRTGWESIPPFHTEQATATTIRAISDSKWQYFPEKYPFQPTEQLTQSVPDLTCARLNAKISVPIRKHVHTNAANGIYRTLPDPVRTTNITTDFNAHLIDLWGECKYFPHKARCPINSECRRVQAQMHI